MKKKRDCPYINTTNCRHELETVEYVVKKNDWETTATGGIVYWFGLAIKDENIKLVRQKKCFYNRYPGMEKLARKKLFCEINNRTRRCFPNQFKVSPISFLIPEESAQLEAYMEAHPKFMFIAKPSGGKGGEGIFLVQKFKDIPRDFNKDTLQELLVQRYIKTPILIDGKKFDLRLYVLIVGFNPI